MCLPSPLQPLTAVRDSRSAMTLRVRPFAATHLQRGIFQVMCGWAAPYESRVGPGGGSESSQGSILVIHEQRAEVHGRPLALMLRLPAVRACNKAASDRKAAM
jgi:hypothetical protein